MSLSQISFMISKAKTGLRWTVAPFMQ